MEDGFTHQTWHDEDREMDDSIEDEEDDEEEEEVNGKNVSTEEVNVGTPIAQPELIADYCGVIVV